MVLNYIWIAFFLIAFVGVIFINLCFIGIDGVDDLLLGQSGKFRFDYNGLHTISLDGGGRRRWCCFCLHARPDLSRRNFFGTRAELAGRVPFFGIHHAKGQHPAAPPLPCLFSYSPRIVKEMRLRGMSTSSTVTSTS